MVNVNSFKNNDEYLTYYKQSLTDDSPPYQGMIPNYKFFNNTLVEEWKPVYASLKSNIKNDSYTPYHQYIYLYAIFIFFIILCFVNGYNYFKRMNYKTLF